QLGSCLLFGCSSSAISWINQSIRMKVTVTFGQTGVVVPCKDGWTVRDLIQQATQRYRKLLEQEGDFLVRTHHVEYCDGGILDPDDILSDLVEDKDKVPHLKQGPLLRYLPSII
ncbi:Partitioning defective 3 B, partial [Ameca splendens]